MTTEQKIIKNKVGLLKLAEALCARSEELLEQLAAATKEIVRSKKEKKRFEPLYPLFKITFGLSG